MSKKNVPMLRFEGFSDDWEQRKLSDVASIVGGGTPSTSNPEYWDGGIDWYAPAEIGDRIYVNKSLKTITELGKQKSSAKILPIGTVLFTSRAGIGNTAILAKEGTTNQGFQSIVPHENKLDSYFIFSRTHELKRYGEVTGAGSTFAEVSGKQMAKMPILIPYIDEQRKIGAFFGQIDEAIALHQRKLEQLKRLKQGFLQVLFANEVDVPKVRFAGFTEEWEQRKLGSLVEFYSGLTYSPDNITNENGTFVLRSSNVKGGEIVNADNVYVDSAVVNSDNVKVGDIIVVVRNGSRELIGKHAQIKDNMNDTVIGAFMTGIRCQESNFTNALLDTKQFKMEINKNLGATINQITIGSFKKMIFCVTINKKEQLKIGAFFKQLDDTLTLHQNKISQLKKLKKAFLQKMFI